MHYFHVRHVEIAAELNALAFALEEQLGQFGFYNNLGPNEWATAAATIDAMLSGGAESTNALAWKCTGQLQQWIAALTLRNASVFIVEGDEAASFYDWPSCFKWLDGPKLRRGKNSPVVRSGLLAGFQPGYAAPNDEYRASEDKSAEAVALFETLVSGMSSALTGWQALNTTAEWQSWILNSPSLAAANDTRESVVDCADLVGGGPTSTDENLQWYPFPHWIPWNYSERMRSFDHRRPLSVPDRDQWLFYPEWMDAP